MTVIKYFAGGDFRLQIVTEIMMQREFQHIFQHRGLNIQGEPPTLAVSERYPIETHLPTMHVTVNIYRGVRHRFLYKVVTSSEAHSPFACHVELALHVQGVHHVVRILVGVDQSVISQVVVQPVGERIVKGEGPFLPIVLCIGVWSPISNLFFLLKVF